MYAAVQTLGLCCSIRTIFFLSRQGREQVSRHWKRPWELFSWPKRKAFPWLASLPIFLLVLSEPEQAGPGPQPMVATGDSEYHVRGKLVAPKFVLGAPWSPPGLTPLCHTDIYRCITYWYYNILMLRHQYGLWLIWLFDCTSQKCTWKLKKKKL